MEKQTTKSGFKFELDPKRLDNYELLESVSEIEEDPIAVVRVLKLLLGKEDVKRLKEHLRNEDGIVPANKLMNEIQDMFQSQAEIKNS